MPNPKPKLENLTRMGKGRPAKGLARVQITLTPQLLDRIESIASLKGWKRNYLVEQLLRISLGLPSEFSQEDLRQIQNLSE